MSDREADTGQTDRAAPWTVKGIAPEDRNAAIAAAKRERQTIGEWLSRAIRAQAQADHQRDRSPVPITPPADPGSDLDAIERMVGMARSLAEVAGEPPPKQVQRLAYGLIRDRLRALKSPTGSRASQTELGLESD